MRSYYMKASRFGDGFLLAYAEGREENARAVAEGYVRTTRARAEQIANMERFGRLYQPDVAGRSSADIAPLRLVLGELPATGWRLDGFLVVPAVEAEAI